MFADYSAPELLSDLRTYTLSKTARDEILGKLTEWSVTKPLKSRELKIAEDEATSLAIVFDENEQLYLGRKGENEYFPLLKDQFILPQLPPITVDSGAVKFVCNGANIMRPGVTKIEGVFSKSSLVLVKEEKYGKAISVGKSLVSSEEMEVTKKGPVIENLHHVGDKYWYMLKQINL